MASSVFTYSYDGTNSFHLSKWKIRVGSQLFYNSTVLSYKHEDGSKSELKEPLLKYKSSIGGTVTELLVNEGDVVQPGSAILKVQPCTHPVIMKDLCAECGTDLRNLDRDNFEKLTASTTFSMVHVVPELKVSLEQAEKLGRDDEDRLLKTQKLVLLVDLDQTLIHTTNDNVPEDMPGVCHFQLYGSNSPWYHTKLRPGTNNFLEKISKYFEMHICTFGARMYAHKIAKILDPVGKFFSHRILSRDECFDPTSKTANLKALFPRGDNMVCIIDDREDVWNFAPNVIHVKPYTYFRNTGDINAPPPPPPDPNTVIQDQISSATKETHNVVKEAVGQNAIKEAQSPNETKEAQSQDVANEAQDQNAVKEAQGPKVTKEAESPNVTNEVQCQIVTNEAQAPNAVKVAQGLDAAVEDKNSNEAKVGNAEIESQSQGKETEDPTRVKEAQDEHAEKNIPGPNAVKNVQDSIASINVHDPDVQKLNEATNAQNPKAVTNLVGPDTVANVKMLSNTVMEAVNPNVIDQTETPTSIKESQGTNLVNETKGPNLDSKTQSTIQINSNELLPTENKTSADTLNKEFNNTSSQNVSNDFIAPRQELIKLDNKLKENSDSSSISNASETHSSKLENTTSIDSKCDSGSITNQSNRVELKETNSNEKTSVTKNKTEVGKKIDTFTEFSEGDDYLLYLEEILIKVHKTYYELYEKSVKEKKSIPDLKIVVPEIRKKVLKNVNIVFSSIIPTNCIPESHHFWIVAESLGARVTQDFVTGSPKENTTHVVAVKPGTAKVNAAKRLGSKIWIVTLDWLLCCDERWEHADERLFLLPKDACADMENIENAIPKHRRCKRPRNTEKKKAKTEEEKFSERVFAEAGLAFSQDEIEDMDKEVEEACSEESDEESQEGSVSSDSSSSAESLSSGDYPKGWKRRRKCEVLGSELLLDIAEDTSDAETIGSVDEEMAEAVKQEFQQL